MFLAFLCILLISEITSSPVHQNLEKKLKSKAQETGNEFNRVFDDITEAVYFPPSNGNLMHNIRVKVKNDSNDTKDCAIKVWRENSPDSPVTIECDKRRRNVPAPIQLSPENVDVKTYADVGVRKYASTMVNSSASSLDEILDAYSYPPGHNLLYKIKIHMANCNEERPEKSKGTEDCKKMQCIVYVWRETVLDRPVSIECDPVRRKREDFPSIEVNQKGSRRKRDDQPVKINVDDPLMKKHVQMVIDDFGSPNLHDMKGHIVEITDAAMFPSSDKFLYEIKLKVGSTNCSKNSDEQNCQYNPETESNKCELKIFRETVQPSYEISCFGVARRRRGNDDTSQPADLPIEMTIDDPEIKKYVDMAVDKHVSPVPEAHDKKSILVRFKEAKAYPPSGKLLYKIKLRIGSTNCTRGSDEQNCQYNSENDYDDCDVDVLRETDKEPTMMMVCSRVG